MTLSINRLNPNCTTFTVGNRTWYFSYQTCVAYQCLGRFLGDAYKSKLRISESPSPTTAKHMAYMGVADWPRVDDATFEKIAEGTMRKPKKFKPKNVTLTSINRLSKYASHIRMVGDPAFKEHERQKKLYEKAMAEKRGEPLEVES